MQKGAEQQDIAVIFDCDGTLADSMAAWRNVEAELAQRAGGELSQEDVETLTTLSLPECGAFFHEKLGIGSDAQEVVGMINDLINDYYAHQVEPRAGVMDFVEGLAARGIPMAVASSTPQDLLEDAVHHMGLDNYMCAVISVDLVGMPKRFPQVYDRARAELGTTRSHTWGFEDAIYAIRTLRDAGYHACGTYDCDASGTFEELSREADFAVHSFTELDADSFLARARAISSMS